MERLGGRALMGFEADRIKLTPGILCMHTCQIHMLPHQGQLLKSPYQSTEEDKKQTCNSSGCRNGECVLEKLFECRE